MIPRCLSLFTLVITLVPAPTSAASCEAIPGADLHSWSTGPLRIERSSAGGVDSLDNGSWLLIAARNTGPEIGELRIDATVMSETATGLREGVAVATLPGDSVVTIPVPVTRLDLPRDALRYSGVLTFTASIRFSDGRVEHAATPLELYFHAQGEGWLVYGEMERLDLFHGGALTDDDRRLGRGGPSFGSAISRKVSESTSWRPEGDDRPDATAEDAEETSATVKLCIEQYSAFTDAGVGEDLWTSASPTARASRGARVVIHRGTTQIWNGYLGDGRGTGDPGSGCTGELSEPPDPSGTYTYTFQIFTEGQVQGNDINVAYDGSDVLDWNFSRSLTGTGTHVVSFDPTNDTGRAFDVYMVGAYCQYRHTGGVSGQTYRYRLIQNSSDSYVLRFTDTIMIGENAAFLKFVIAHETAHLLGDFATGNNNWKTVSTKCQCYESSSCPSEHGSHTMISKERSRCAVAEGFAQFYSAAVFNWHDTGHYDCWFHYYKEVGGDSSPTLNCEMDSPDGPFDDRYMETNCASPWAGMGTELDWMRAFWDMLSADPLVGEPQMEVSDIVQWFDIADYWHQYYAFNNLDDAADIIGGNLDSQWDYFAPLNGIDWPRYGLLFTDGFENATTECWTD